MTNVAMRRQGSTKIVEEGYQTESVRYRVVLCADNFSREFLQRVKRFVGEARTAYHGNRIAAVRFGDCVKPLRREANRFVPGRRNQLAAFLISNQRRAKALFVIDERMPKAAFDAEKLSVQSVHVTVARDDAHQLVASRTKRHLATVRTIRARRDSLR